MVLVYFLISFLSGSIMFSYLIGKIFLHVDIRNFEDGRNPGARSLYAAGGNFLGTIGLILDFTKGFLPVFFAKYIFEFNQNELILISIAPILGHSFSPFLKFKGGKALANTFGIWSGLTLWEAPIVIGFFYTVMILSFKKLSHSIITICGFLILFIYLLATSRHETYLFYIWLFNFIVMFYKLNIIKEFFSKKRTKII